MSYKPEHLKQWTTPESYGGFNPIGDYCIAGQHRDSDALERSNYRRIFADLVAKAESLGVQDNGIDGEGNESPMVYDFRAGHWAVGWVEEILICQNAPDELLAFADEIAAGLLDNPVYDETDWSSLEIDEVCEYWERSSIRDRIEFIIESRCGASIFAARHDYLPQDDNGSLYDCLLRG